ncbi:vacuolar amino acid permease [Mycena latifolia]|nr:vacuolar amino acid permease [Mycena latifolia]
MSSSLTDRSPLINKSLDLNALHRHNVKSDHGPGPPEISKSNRRAILAGIWMAAFLGALNTTLVPTTIPSISSEFQKFHQASWIGTVYLLAMCIFTPLYGRLCNVMGRRGANQLAISFAALGTIGCGLSRNMETLIAARFIADIGGGGIFTTSRFIVSDMYSLRDQGLVQGAASCFNGLGMGFGGFFGGVITDWSVSLKCRLKPCPNGFQAWLAGSLSPSGPRSLQGKSKGAAEILKRIDYMGSLTLLISVGSFLLFLGMRYSENLPWSDAWVGTSLVMAIVFILLFLIVEMFVAPEPVLAPSMLRQKIPVFVGASNSLSSACNFTIIYFFPVWFQVVALESASTAGILLYFQSSQPNMLILRWHLMPNSVSMSTGALFAGWMIHKTGRYKAINLIFGIFPFVGTELIASMSTDSGSLQSWLRSWLSIISFGFGNAVVIQTNLIALLAHLPPKYQSIKRLFRTEYSFVSESQVATGTGFAQLFQGLGQVGGVAISSALFQMRLDAELRKRIHTPDAEELIIKIRRSNEFIRTLEPAEQHVARDAYAMALKSAYILATCATLLAYMARLPIPDQDLDMAQARRRESSSGAEADNGSNPGIRS